MIYCSAIRPKLSKFAEKGYFYPASTMMPNATGAITIKDNGEERELGVKTEFNDVVQLLGHLRLDKFEIPV